MRSPTFSASSGHRGSWPKALLGDCADTRGRRGAAAFSLIEVMLALLLLGVSIVGLTHGMTTALTLSKESEQQATAALLAAGRLETLRAEGDLEPGADEGDFGQAFPLYRWQQSVNPTSIDGLYEVVVLVEHAQTHQGLYELRTLLFQAPFAPGGDTAGARAGSTRTRRRADRSP